MSQEFRRPEISLDTGNICSTIAPTTEVLSANSDMT